ncbi:MAG: ECF-type sigma factor [Gemmatimonadales bacterium]
MPGTDPRHAIQPDDALLSALRAGDRSVLDQLFSLAYDELRRLAHQTRGWGGGSMTTTALVHETYLKLLPARLPVEDRTHLRMLIGRAMRQVLIDASRRRLAAKRGGGGPVLHFDPDAQGAPMEPEQVLRLHEALTELEAIDPRRAAVATCRYFAGLDVQETAEALGISTPTVKRDWRVARAWLADALA